VGSERYRYAFGKVRREATDWYLDLNDPTTGKHATFGPFESQEAALEMAAKYGEVTTRPSVTGQQPNQQWPASPATPSSMEVSRSATSGEPPAPPRLSPDGKFYWNGKRWVPMPASGRNTASSAARPRLQRTPAPRRRSRTRAYLRYGVGPLRFSTPCCLVVLGGLFSVFVLLGGGVAMLGGTGLFGT